MPFDGTEFRPRREPSGPSPADGTAAGVIIAAVVFLSLVFPFSLPALIDLVRFVRG